MVFEVKKKTTEHYLKTIALKKTKKTHEKKNTPTSKRDYYSDHVTPTTVMHVPGWVAFGDILRCVIQIEISYCSVIKHPNHLTQNIFGNSELWHGWGLLNNE